MRRRLPSRKHYALQNDTPRPKDVAFFNIGIRIYRGTELEHRAREEAELWAVPPGEMSEPVLTSAWPRSGLADKYHAPRHGYHY